MNELCHHGVKGQKWGVRRYQNEDGSLIPAGKKGSIESNLAVYDEPQKRWMLFRHY